MIPNTPSCNNIMSKASLDIKNAHSEREKLKGKRPNKNDQKLVAA
jgi:hypothetical protein